MRQEATIVAGVLLQFESVGNSAVLLFLQKNISEEVKANLNKIVHMVVFSRVTFSRHRRSRE